MNIKNGIIAVIVFCLALFGMTSLIMMLTPNPHWSHYVGAGGMVLFILGFVFKIGASVNV